MVKKVLVLLWGILLLLPVVGCSGSAQEELSLEDYKHFVQVPLIRQGTTYTCGVTCLHSLLRWASYDLDINDEILAKSCATTEQNGTNHEPILQYLIETKMFEASWKENMTIEQLKEIIDKGGCVMISIQAWEYKQDKNGDLVSFSTQDYADYWAGGHWVIACGYNEDSILFMDPSTAGCYTQIPMEDLDIRWHDTPDDSEKNPNFKKCEHGGIIVYCLDGGTYDSNTVCPLL